MAFRTNASLSYGNFRFSFGVTNSVPLPFNTFTLELPKVEKVDPTIVKRGQQFEIIGTGLYPSLVTAVQLGGDALPTGNFTPTDDTDITVVVPSTVNTGNQFVGVQTSQGQSNTDVTIRVQR